MIELRDDQLCILDSAGQPATAIDPPLLPWGEKLVRGAVLCRAGKHAEAVKDLEDWLEGAAGGAREAAIC